MIRPEVDEFIAFLDSLAQIDPVAMGQLMQTRVRCNEQMRDHPTVQVDMLGAEHGRVGMLGILNGWIGVIDDGPQKGWGEISALLEKDGSVTGFRRTSRVNGDGSPKLPEPVGSDEPPVEFMPWIEDVKR